MKQRSVVKLAILSMVIMIILSACSTNGNNEGESKDGQEVNVFTARHYDIDAEIYKAFEEETGIKVNTIEGSAEELVERMKREGEGSEADLFITVDGGVLEYAKSSGVLQAIDDETVLGNVPEHLRDKDNEWVGMATRARVIAYAKDRVDPATISTYEDLASDSWKGKVLVRSSSNLYNQSLVASLIELNGEAEAEAWAKGIVANLARDPEGGDRDQAKGIAAGVGDVAIMNTYYVGQMLNSEDAEEVKVAENIGLIFPNQGTTGTHLNISGIGLAAHAKNKANAQQLIAYMTSKKGQEMLTNGSYEFPVNVEAELPALLQEWGNFEAQQIDFAALGQWNTAATELMNKVGWK